MAYELYTRPCRQCGKDLVTTSTRKVVHDECRKAYYDEYHKRRFRETRPLDKVTQTRNRSRVLVNDQPCAACSYMLITKKRKFYNRAAKKMEEFNLCPRCLAEIRCGFMEVFTWKGSTESSGLSGG